MAVTNNHISRTRKWQLAWRALPRPTAEFAGAAALGGLLVAGLAAGLPGATPEATVVAVTLYVIAAGVAGRALHRDYPHMTLGLCNFVTLGRLVLVGALVAPVLVGGGPGWAVFALAALALSLDGVDGWLARRQCCVSSFGARFDMEVDSLLALVLALNLAFGSGLGAAAVLLGLPRYVFALSGLVCPWMRRDLPDRFSRKAVCVLQLGALIALHAPVLPALPAALLVSAVVLALVWSFAVDVVWLWRRRV